MVLGAILTSEMADGIILVTLVALAGALIRVWVLCAKLWEMHNVKDGEGRPVWYGQERSIEALNEILSKLEKTTDKQCRLLDALVGKVGSMSTELTQELLRIGMIQVPTGTVPGKVSAGG